MKKLSAMSPVAWLLFAGVAASDGRTFGKEDNVACVIGRAILKVQDGMDIDAAQALAYASCGAPPPSLTGGDDGGEGFGDFINLAVTRFAQ